MKIELGNDKASRLVNCGEVILVASGFQGIKNITTCAWHMPLSKTPPLIAIALAKKHFTSELIVKAREFTVNILPWSLLDKAVFCGSVSGRKIDKFKEAGLTAQKATKLKEAFKITESIGDIECVLYDTQEAGDHFIFVGEAVYAQVEEKYFINGFWDTNKVELIFHLGGKMFFKSSSFSEFKAKDTP